MQEYRDDQSERLSLKRFVAMLAVVWTLLILSMAMWDMNVEEGKMLEEARTYARSAIERDFVYRDWLTGHGGVYVTVTDESLPNPYLTNVEERDITTPSGKRLTLINAAYMTRQVHELATTTTVHEGRITSLNPLNPINAPDLWEAEALRSFERGETEYASLEFIHEDEHLRLMLPMITEQSCLQCHSEQGYKEGDIRGGIAVGVLMAPLRAATRAHLTYIFLGDFGIWIAGLCGITLSARPLSRRIRERDHARAELQSSKDFLQTVVDGLPEAVVVIERDWRVVLANKAVRERSGGVDPVLCGLNCYEVLHDREAPCAETEQACPFERVFETKAPHTVLQTHLDDEGNEIDVEIVAAPIFDESGEVVRVIESSRDVTERTRAMVEARLYEEHLLQIDKMASLGILVSGVAHEINNPNQFVMTNLTLFSEVWESAQPIVERYYKENGDFLLGDLPYTEMREQMPKMLSEAFRGCQRMKYIVEELRDFARQGPADLTESVDMASVVRSAVTLLTKMIEKSTRRFSVEYAKDLVELRGNSRRLEQVVINLIQNSCQALPDMERAISVSTFYDDAEKAVILKVEDEGMGISDEALDHAMDPFFTTRRESGGTGLGLSIASNIVRQHGGTLKIDSVVDVGTTVTIALPVRGKSDGEPKPALGQSVEGQTV